MNEIRLKELPRKKMGKDLLFLGFKECSKPYNFVKQFGKRQIHIKWKWDGLWAGYYAHIDKEPHI